MMWKYPCHAGGAQAPCGTSPRQGLQGSEPAGVRSGSAAPPAGEPPAAAARRPAVGWEAGLGLKLGCGPPLVDRQLGAGAGRSLRLPGARVTRVTRVRIFVLCASEALSPTGPKAKGRASARTSPAPALVASLPALAAAATSAGAAAEAPAAGHGAAEVAQKQVGPAPQPGADTAMPDVPAALRAASSLLKALNPSIPTSGELPAAPPVSCASASARARAAPIAVPPPPPGAAAAARKAAPAVQAAPPLVAPDLASALGAQAPAQCGSGRSGLAPVSEAIRIMQ